MNREKDLLYCRIPLRIGADGKFRVLVFSDAHAGVGFSRQVAPAIRALLAADRPDLVLFNGDTAGPGRIHVEDAEQLRAVLTELTAPVEELGIPWAHTFGNHDDNFGLKNEDAEKVYESFPYCVSKAGDPDVSGVANYVLPVLGRDGKPAFALWGLDSHGDLRSNFDRWGIAAETPYVLPVHFAEGTEYDTVRFDQAMWYYNASKEIEARCGRKLPGLMCMHIPLPEMWLVANNPTETGFKGNVREEIACSEMNSGLFMACLERGDVRAIVFGHDHVNDFTGEYCGITLAYDGAIEYDAYQDDDLRGGRMFVLDENDPRRFATYMVRVRDVMGEKGDRNPPRVASAG